MTLERLEKFSEREQLLILGSEFERARVWQNDKNSEEYTGALTRALEIIDLMLQSRDNERVGGFFMAFILGNGMVKYQVW